jgi:predicted nucleotide-binding protein
LEEVPDFKEENKRAIGFSENLHSSLITRQELSTFSVDPKAAELWIATTTQWLFRVDPSLAQEFFESTRPLKEPDPAFDLVPALETINRPIRKAIARMESQPNPTQVGMEAKATSQRVFVVHGHDHGLKNTVARFLEHCGLAAIILHEQPDQGLTIIEKFSHHSDVSFAVVLLTGDDIGNPKGSPKRKARARQNVIFELGFFIGKLGRSRVSALYEEGVELPSDLHGVLYTAIDEHESWKYKLAKELRAAGLSVNLP